MNVLTLLRYAFRLSATTLVGCIALQVLGAGLVVVTPLLVGGVVGRLPGVAANGPGAGFLVLLGLLLVALPMSNVVESIAAVPGQRLGSAAERDIFLRVGAAGSGRPGLASLDDPEVVSRLQRIKLRRRAITGNVEQACGSLIGLSLGLVGSAAAVGVVFSWWAALVLLAAAVGRSMYGARNMNRQMDVWSSQTEGQKHAEYAFSQGMGGAAKELRIFGLSGFLRERYWQHLTGALAPYWRLRRHQAVEASLVGLAQVAITVAVFGYAGWQATNGRLTLGGLSATLPLVASIAGINVENFSEVQRGAKAYRWLEELHPARSRTVATSPAGAGDAHSGESAGAPTIVFEDVSFRYPRADSDTLRGLSMRLDGGAAVALVGVNGTGKSTLVKLLAGAYRPTSGRILVDGVDLASLDEDELRCWQRRVAPITQDFVRLPLPAGDNVELGTGVLWSGHIDGEQRPVTEAMEAVAARAGIVGLLDGLPRQWATLLEKTLPGGVDLSGGEWQRLALARALRAVDAGAGVLVLDEPAAALDVESEAQLVSGYLDLARAATSLVISHRFSVVRPVPKICVLEYGRIVEEGSHEELMAARGRYHDLFTMQASRYGEGDGDA